MSALSKCPHCKKYIDVTFSPKTCPNCSQSLTPNEIIPEELSAGTKAVDWVAVSAGIITSLFISLMIASSTGKASGGCLSPLAGFGVYYMLREMRRDKKS